MLSAVAVRIPNSIASNTSPTTHRIKKITFTFGCLSKIFSDKNLKKSNVKSQTKTSQSHPQSHIFQILIQILHSIISWLGELVSVSYLDVCLLRIHVPIEFLEQD